MQEFPIKITPPEHLMRYSLIMDNLPTWQFLIWEVLNSDDVDGCIKKKIIEAWKVVING